MSVAVAVAEHRREQLDRALLELLTSLVGRAPLFADVRARGQADDVVQEALLAVHRRLAAGGTEIGDPHAYATRVVQNLARRAYIRAVPEDPVPHAELDAADDRLDPARLVEQRAELARVLEMVALVHAVVEELDPVDVEIVRGELARSDQHQLARRLAMPRASFYRRKRRALEAFVTTVAARGGTEPCRDRRSALLGAAAGSNFAAAAEARAHCEACGECAATLRHLGVAQHALGVIVPLPPLIGAADPGAVERLVTVVQSTVDWLRSVAVRGPDPSAVLPSSKPIVAAVAAACVGVGGSTYCAVEGMPRPVRDALGIHRAPAVKPAGRATARRQPVVKRTIRATRLTPAVVAATHARRPTPAPAAQRTRSPSRRTEFKRSAKPGTSQAEREFAAPAASAPAAVTARATGTAPARSAGSGAATKEFGGGEFGG